MLDICDSDPERKGRDMGMSLGRERPLTVVGMDVYRRMYWQGTWCFFPGVQSFWLWNSCVCVHSYSWLYLHIHSCLWKCVFLFSRAKHCIPFFFFFNRVWGFFMLFVFYPFYNSSVPLSPILWQLPNVSAFLLLLKPVL